MAPTEQSAATLVSDATGTWTLDPAATTVTLSTKAMWGLMKVKATFAAVEGSGTVTDDGAVTGSLLIDAASVNTKNAKRDTHLKGEDFFEVETYPQFTYTVTGVNPSASGSATVDGSLTVQDQTHPLALDATVAESGPGRVVITAETDMNRSEWGVGWAKMGAGLANHIVVRAEFTKS